MAKTITQTTKQILRERILSQQYEAGTRLPSETELAEELQVSRATLRSALAQLASEGVIVRRQGDGTFVSSTLHRVNTQLGGLLDFWRLIEQSGHKPSIDPLSIGERRATAEEAVALGVAEGALLLVLVRLFSADSHPFILATNLIPHALLLTPPPTFFDGRLGLPQFLARYCGQELASAVYTITAIQSTPVSAEILQLPPLSPLLQLQITFSNANKQPLALGDVLYNPQTIPLRFVQTWS